MMANKEDQDDFPTPHQCFEKYLEEIAPLLQSGPVTINDVLSGWAYAIAQFIGEKAPDPDRIVALFHEDMLEQLEIEKQKKAAGKP